MTHLASARLLVNLTGACNMAIYNVTYTVYEKGSNNVVSEGTMPINTSSSYLAEQTVKSMFNGADVVIRYTTG